MAEVSTIKKPERIDYVDIFRSFGIILMVMGHIGYGGKFDFFIHAFHMPMFFWISGYLFVDKKELTLVSLIKKKAKTLLLPYIVFGIAHWLFFVLLYGYDTRLLLNLFLFNTTDLPIAGALWFLTALFFTDIIFFLIDRHISSAILKTLVIMFIAIGGNVARYIFPFKLPWALSASCVGVGLYYIGYAMRRLERENKIIQKMLNLSWIQIIILGALCVWLFFKNGYINMRIGAYSNVPLFWFNATFSIIVLFDFARQINSIIKDFVIGKWLVNVGSNSIVYLCLNQVVILILGKCLDHIHMNVVIYKIIILVLTLIVLHIVSLIITSTKLKIIIGK